jgi:hypothetical protein
LGDLIFFNKYTLYKKKFEKCIKEHNDYLYGANPYFLRMVDKYIMEKNVLVQLKLSHDVK